MNTHELCIASILEIRERLRTPNEYNYLMIAGIIRKLLFDKNSLLRLAQQQSDKRFIFFVEPLRKKSEVDVGYNYLDFYIAGDIELCIDRLVEIPIDDYGSLVVMQHQDNVITIKDVIRFVSNKRGAIHIDFNISEDQEIIDTLSRRVYFFGLEAVYHQTACIGKNIVSSAVRSGWIGY